MTVDPRVVINRKTGLVDDPIFPCYKGEGLCKLRAIDTEKVACVYDPAICRHRKPGQKGNSPEGRASTGGKQETVASQPNGGTDKRGDSQGKWETDLVGEPEGSSEALWSDLGREKEDG